MKRYSLILSLLLLISSMAVATDKFAQHFSFDGQLLNSSGNPITPAPDVKIQILNPSGTCVLFDVTYDDLALDSDGNFSIKIGPNGDHTSRDTTSDGNLAWETIFQSKGPVRPSASGCAGGYDPSLDGGSNHDRKLKITVNGTALTPDYSLSPAPWSAVAQTLQGKGVEEFLTTVSGGDFAIAWAKGLRFVSDNATNFVSLKAPAGVTTDVVLTLPATDGNANEFLKTDGAGVLSWAAVTAATTSLPAGSIAAPEISFASDADTGIHHVAGNSGKIDFVTDGTIAMTVSQGKIGIGTSTPMAPLEIATMSTEISNTTVVQSKSSFVINPGSNSAATFIGQSSALSSNSSFTMEEMRGLSVSLAHSGTGTLDKAKGLHVEANNMGNVTKAYGIYVGPVVGSQKYSIYTSDPFAPNYFGSSIYGGPFGTGAGQTGNLRLMELAASGTNFFMIRAPDSLGADRTWTLPDSNGSSGQVLSTDGAGNLSWIAAGAGGDIDGVVTNAGSGLTGGVSSGTATLAVVTDNATVEISGGNQLRLKDGGVSTAKIADTAVADAKIATVSVNKITAGVGQYFNYTPNGGACAIGEVLKKTVLGWECGADNGVLDHGALTGITDDDHPQYVSLLGRSGGQILRGSNAASENLTLESTSNATKGTVLIQPTGGNVAIGTNNPQAHLHINMNGAVGSGLTIDQYMNPAILKLRTAQGTAASPSATQSNDTIGKLAFNGHDGSGFIGFNSAEISAIAAQNFDGTSRGGHLVFSTIPNTPSAGLFERMRITSDGLVGVGTINPGAMFTVKNSSANNTNPAMRVMAAGAQVGDFFTVTNSSGSAVFFSVANTGSVGVGTENAASSLDVVSMNISAPVLSLQALAGQTGDLLKIANDGGTQLLNVKSNGNLGIGTVNPSSKLQVAGVISPAGDGIHDLGTMSNKFATIYAQNSVINTSDARQKTDIEDSDLGLDFISKLRPVSYRWIHGKDKSLHYGLIAQEAEKTIDASKSSAADVAIVTHDLQSDRYGIRYTELISPMIKAVQELKRENDQLKAQLEEQKSEASQVRAELNEIKKMLKVR